MSKKILICDDNLEFEESLTQKLMDIKEMSGYFDIEYSGGSDEGKLEAAIQALENRLKRASKEELDDYPEDDAVIIDEADILVIDYELIEIDASVTGERAAYLARCYSRCGLIIGLNQFPPYVEQSFDLTLRGHPESYCDLNISSNSLSNKGLWMKPWTDFRPWYWSLPPLSINKYENRVRELKDHIDDYIFDFLGLSEAEWLSIPRSISQYISKTGDPSKTNFRDFVKDSGNGIRGRGEKPISDESIARIAAARISNWLENLILPGQNTLVDAPHLVLRFPSILGNGSEDIEEFNKLATFANNEELGLSPLIEPFRFKKDDWLDRPAWFWSALSNNEEIKEVSDPWSSKRPEFVFCEDISRFVSEEETRSFIADLESPFKRRYVRFLDNINYQPSVRFSL